MNLKKTLAALSAGVVAVASMATVAASAQEAGSRTFDTFDVRYYAKGTVTATMASGDANDTFRINLNGDPGNPGGTPAVPAVPFFDHTNWADGQNAFASVKVTKLKIGGDTYTDEEEINTFVDADKETGIVEITALGAEAGKVVSVTIEVESPKYEDKDDAKNIAKKDADGGDHEVKLADGAFDRDGTTGDLKVEGGKASVKACTSKYYMQIGVKPDGTNVDDEAWAHLDAYAPGWAHDKTTALENLDTEVANTLAANRGAKLVFYFADKKEAEDDGLESAPDYGQDTGWSDGETEDFAIRVNGTKSLTGIGVVDADALTISFDWDTVLAKSNLVNAVGQVDTIEYKANEDGFLYDENYDKDQDDATYRYEITKIVVEWPASDAVAEDMSDLAAGEAETTVEAALPGADAAATTAAASTDAADNPSTGNSAVALAVIPVAIAAAAFVAKKRG